MNIKSKILNIALLLIISGSALASTLVTNYTPLFQQFKINAKDLTGWTENFTLSNPTYFGKGTAFVLQSLPGQKEGKVRFFMDQDSNGQRFPDACVYWIEFPVKVENNTIIASASNGQAETYSGCAAKLYTITGDPALESGYQINIS